MCSVIKSIRYINSLLGKYKKYIHRAYPVAVIESGMTFIPYMLLFYILSVGLKRPFIMKDFYIVSGIMFLGTLIRGLLKRTLDMLQQDKGFYAFAENRLELTDHLSKLNMGYYTDSNIGNITSVVTTDIVFIEENAMMQLGLAISAIANMIPALIYLVVFDLRLALLYVLLNFIGIKAIDYLAEAMKRNARGRQDNFGKLSQEVINYIRGMQTIKAFRIQGKSQSAMEDRIDATKEGAIEFINDAKNSQILHLFTVNIATFFMILLVSYLMIFKGFNLAYGLGFIVSSFVLFMPLNILGSAMEILQVSDAAVERYDEIMAEEPISDNTNGPVPKKVNIAFKNVSFAYEEKEVLKNISLEISEGSFTALVGKSGSGKTTIANLIARFWDIKKGEITIDNIPIKEIPQKALHGSISMVFQRVYLFNDTIFNNIAFANPDASYEEVVAAAKKARCHDFIMKLPQGYDTMVDEGGSNLSGGEKQRISIARAILKDAPLILLDEATAGVDPENERYIQEAIDELIKNKTLIVIAHRLSTIQKADQIVYLEEGEIVEKGTHEQLIELNGKYKRQYDFYKKIKEN